MLGIKWIPGLLALSGLAALSQGILVCCGHFPSPSFREIPFEGGHLAKVGLLGEEKVYRLDAAEYVGPREPASNLKTLFPHEARMVLVGTDIDVAPDQDGVYFVARRDRSATRVALATFRAHGGVRTFLEQKRYLPLKT